MDERPFRVPRAETPPRGLRRKAAEAATAAAAATGQPAQTAADAAPVPVRNRSSQTWAMLIKRVYEIAPLVCARCGGQMKVVAFIEPPQGDVVEKILRHCGLWNPSAPQAPPAGNGPSGREAASSDEPRELTFVDIDTFEATF